MFNISIRGEQMPQSFIRKLVPHAYAAVGKGVNIFKFNIS